MKNKVYFLGLLLLTMGVVSGCSLYKTPPRTTTSSAQVQIMPMPVGDKITHETLALPPASPDKSESIDVAAASPSIITPPATSSQQKESTTVKVLVDEARRQFVAGEYPQAESTLERALRIEPRNPRLWSNMARLRLAQDRPNEAVPLAVKSNRLAGNNTALKKHNLRMMQDAYTAMNQPQKAQEVSAKIQAL